MPSLLGKLPQSVTQEKKAEAAAKGYRSATELLMQDMSPQHWQTSGSAFTNQTFTQLAPLNTFYSTNPIILPSHLATPYNHYAATFLAANSVAPQPARGAMADKIRQALDTVVTLDIKDKPFGEALKIIQQKAAGIPFHKVLPEEFMKEKVTLQLEQVSL